MSQPVHVVLCTDSNNLWGVAVTVRSLLERATDACHLHILGVDLKRRDQDLLSRSWEVDSLAHLDFFPIDRDQLAPFRSTLYLRSKAAYGRLFIGDYLSDVPRCIYLDTDLLVLADVRELYNVDLQGKVAGCVRDICVRRASPLPALIARLQHKLGLADPCMYFNSGVMLIDLDRWRREDVQSQAVQIGVEMYDSLDVVDQDLLNVVLKERWLDLDVRWNTSQYEAPEDFDNGILHLIGTTKPWHVDYDYKFKDQFFDILDRTAFSKMRPRNTLGLGAFYKKIYRRVPTVEMIRGKFRRSIPLRRNPTS